MSFGATQELGATGDVGYYEQELYDQGKSPFRPPNDEEIFVTRETEKARKKEAKEAL